MLAFCLDVADQKSHILSSEQGSNADNSCPYCAVACDLQKNQGGKLCSNQPRIEEGFTSSRLEGRSEVHIPVVHVAS